MKKYEELHTLVHSLSQSEKRYFRAGGRGDENYFQLFDAILAQETYNEAEIKVKFQGVSFVKQLHVAKNYLTRQILKSLRNYHNKISKDAEAKDILRNVEILYRRELFRHCSNELTRAERLARTYELSTAMTEVLSWRRKLLQALKPSDFQSFKEIVEEQHEVVEGLLRSVEYWNLTVDISISVSGPGASIDTGHPLLKSVDMATSVQSRVLYYHCLYYLNLMESKSVEAKNNLEELVAYLDEHQNFTEEDPGIYISTVNNLITYLVFNRKYEEALHYLDTLKSRYGEQFFKAGNKQVLRQMMRTYNIELEIYRDLRNFHVNEDAIADVERFIEQNESRIPRNYLPSFWFQLACIHFFKKSYSRSLKWVNEVMNIKTSIERPDILYHARMLNLMVHFELRNFFALGYFIENCRRFLRKESALEPYHQVIFRFLKKAVRNPDLDIKLEMTGLKEELFPDQKDPIVNQEVLDYIDYKTWIINTLEK